MMGFQKEVEKRINKDFEFIGYDRHPIGEEVMIFKDKDKKTYGIMVFEME